MGLPNPPTQLWLLLRCPGRESELAALGGLFEALRRGKGGLALLSGEPGIGKTTLLDRVLAEANGGDLGLCHGRAVEMEKDLPFALLGEALAREVDVPALEDSESGDPNLRYRQLRELRRAVNELAGKRPLVLALDDFHWADPASIDLICQLLYRPLANPCLLLLAFRPAILASRLRTAFAQAQLQLETLQLELEPLSEAAAEGLLAGVGAAEGKAIYRESGGNPLYMEQLANAARQGPSEGASSRVSAGTSEVPPLVIASIAAEASHLSTAARSLAEAAALLREPFDADLATETASLPPSDRAAAIDELIDADLLRTTELAGELRFRHPVIRKAIEDSTGVGWRRAAHARAAAILDRQQAPASVRAPHIEASAPAGDADAAVTLKRAGEEALAHSPASAARWFSAARRILPEREDTLEMRLALLIQNAMALGIAGELGESRSALADFLELVSADSHEMRSQAVIFAAILDELLGTHEVGRHLLLGELAGVSDPKGPEAADLMRELAFTFFFDADWAAMRDAASGSLEAECEGMIRVGSLAALALADFGLGQPELMRPSVAEAARVFDSLSDPAIAAHHPGIAIWLGWAEVCTERFADAIGHLGRAIEVSRASGQRHHTVGLLSVQAQALAMIGEGQELRIAASDALEEALLSSSSLYLSWAMTTQCQVALWGGELVAAINFGEQALAAALQSKTPQADLARVQLASALIESGEAERGRALLISPEGEPDLPPFPFYETLCMELLVRAELAAGELESAEEHAGWALAGAERLGLELPISQARRASALVMAARKRWPDAAEEASASAAAARSAGAAVESARSMVIAAQATAAIGKRERAIEMLEAARKCFHESEATRYEEQAIRELRRLGRTVPRLRGEGRAQPGGLGLTNRELDVIALIVEGKTNREIAEELILSVRTVDRHVERIFSKLEVHSRAAAASVFERARLSG